MNRPPVKPKLLVLELWGLGDLAIATPFLRAAAEKYSVTLLAKPQACELLPRLWPTIEVIPFNAPWTAFRGKYHLWRWDWREMLQLRRRLRAEKFDCVVSGRWDPRDHLLMKATRAAARLGFPRLNSGCLLTQSLSQPHQLAHRAEFWRVAGAALGLAVPRREEIIPPPRPASAVVFIHTGAAQPVRVWPLENYRQIAARLREKNFTVQIACDPDQLDWWQQQGENAVCPRRLSELFTHLDGAGIFIGNDSGPGHLAAVGGIATFTLFGPQLPERFIPLHPAAEVFAGRACPYKPCSDYCHYEKPFCLGDVTVDEIWPRLSVFAEKQLRNR